LGKDFLSLLKTLGRSELPQYNEWGLIALFSKSGFTNSLKKVAESEGALFYDLNDIKKILWG